MSNVQYNHWRKCFFLHIKPCLSFTQPRYSIGLVEIYRKKHSFWWTWCCNLVVKDNLLLLNVQFTAQYVTTGNSKWWKKGLILNLGKGHCFLLLEQDTKLSLLQIVYIYSRIKMIIWKHAWKDIFPLRGENTASSCLCQLWTTDMPSKCTRVGTVM